MRGSSIGVPMLRGCFGHEATDVAVPAHLGEPPMERMAGGGGPQSFSDLYDLGELIGQGAYGTVHVVKRKADGLVLVVKQIPVGRMNVEERAAAEHEADILRSLDHANICRYFDSIVEVRTQRAARLAHSERHASRLVRSGQASPRSITGHAPARPCRCSCDRCARSGNDAHHSTAVPPSQERNHVPRHRVRGGRGPRGCHQGGHRAVQRVENHVLVRTRERAAAAAPVFLFPVAQPLGRFTPTIASSPALLLSCSSRARRACRMRGGAKRFASPKQWRRRPSALVSPLCSGAQVRPDLPRPPPRAQQEAPSPRRVPLSSSPLFAERG